MFVLQLRGDDCKIASSPHNSPNISGTLKSSPYISWYGYGLSKGTPQSQNSLIRDIQYLDVWYLKLLLNNCKLQISDVTFNVRRQNQFKHVVPNWISEMHVRKNVQIERLWRTPVEKSQSENTIICGKMPLQIRWNHIRLEP